jgi:hypothetical protein
VCMHCSMITKQLEDDNSFIYSISKYMHKIASATC